MESIFGLLLPLTRWSDNALKLIKNLINFSAKHDKISYNHSVLKGEFKDRPEDIRLDYSPGIFVFSAY